MMIIQIFQRWCVGVELVSPNVCKPPATESPRRPRKNAGACAHGTSPVHLGEGP